MATPHPHPHPNPNPNPNQERVWSDMSGHGTSLKQRIALLDFLWGIFPEERQPQVRLRNRIRAMWGQP